MVIQIRPLKLTECSETGRSELDGVKIAIVHNIC